MGTCEAADASTRLCAAGTGDCPGVRSRCVDASSCNNHGTCARDVQGTLTCGCDPGWTGADCSEEVTCPHNCHALLRHACVSITSCGVCLPGHSHTGDHLWPGA